MLQLLSRQSIKTVIDQLGRVYEKIDPSALQMKPRPNNSNGRIATKSIGIDKKFN